MRYVYLIKFAIYVGIASYDYSIGSKWVLAWSMLAVMMLAFFIVEEVRHLFEEYSKLKT